MIARAAERARRAIADASAPVDLTAGGGRWSTARGGAGDARPSRRAACAGHSPRAGHLRARALERPCRRARRFSLPVAALAPLFGVLLAATAARAASVETRVRLLLRDRPSQGGRVVERLPARTHLVLLGRSSDGAWVRVQLGRREGWLPAAQVAIRDASDGAAEPTTAPAEGAAASGGAATTPPAPTAPPPPATAVEPIAPRRHVRPELWIAESRYHDGLGPSRVKVTRARAELLARPVVGAPRVGAAKRGEELVVVRTSRDGRWYLVELGGGDIAWVAASAVGGARPAALAPQVSRPTADDDGTSPPAAAGSSRDARDAAPADEARRAPAIPRGDEDPSSPAAASSADADAASAAPDDELAATLSPRPTTRVAATAGVGFALLGQTFSSNAHGRLTHFEAGTAATAIEATLGGALRLGGRIHGGLDLAYRFAGAAGIVVHAPSGDVTLAVQSHHLDALVSLGYRADALGGLTASIGVGGVLLLDAIEQSARAPLPSERVVALAVGARLWAPSLWRGLGASIEALALPAGSLGQTGNLGEGSDDGTLGAAVTGALEWRFASGLLLHAGAHYGYVTTHLVGRAQRNPAISRADRDASATTLSIGLGYSR